jgi:hypothetical protein
MISRRPLAKERGAYRGRKRHLSEREIEELCQRIDAGEKKNKSCAGIWHKPRNVVYVFTQKEGVGGVLGKIHKDLAKTIFLHNNCEE